MSASSTPPGGLGIVFGLLAAVIAAAGTVAVLGLDALAIATAVAIALVIGATFAGVSYALTRS